MKTLYNITTAVLVFATVSAFASDGKEKDNNKNAKEAVKLIKAPAFTWGEPVEVRITEEPKVSKIAYPAFEWGEPVDVTIEENPAAKLAFPEFQWGNPDELPESVDSLKFALPAFQWGNPEQIDL